MGHQRNFNNNNDRVIETGYDVSSKCDVDHERSCLLQDHEEKMPLVVTESTRPVPPTWLKIVILMCCIVLHVIINGIGYGLSIMYAELIIVFKSPRAEAALIQGLYMGFSTGAGIFFVGPIKRLGPGRSIMVGAVISCVGLAASGFSQNITSVILLTGCLAAIGMCLCYLGAFLTVSWVFYKDPGFYLTCLTIGSSTGQMIIPVFYEMFIRDYSWSGAFILIAGISLQCFPLGLFIHFCRHYFYAGDAKSKTSGGRPVCDVTLFKDGVILVLLLNFHLTSLTGNVEAWFIVDFMISRGFTRESGSTLVSLIGGANCIGRIIGAAIRFKCITFPTIYHWVYLCPITALVHALVINVYDYWSILILCVIYGVSFGTSNAQAPAIMYEATGLERYPQGIAMVNAAFGVGNILSNLLGGYIMDSLVEYDAAFYIASGTSLFIAIASAIVAVFIRRRNQRKLINTSVTSTVKYETLK